MDRGKLVLDTDRIDDAVLALLHLGLHDGSRAWKGFDWEAMNRLHEKGMISARRQGEVRRLHRGRPATIGRPVQGHVHQTAVITPWNRVR